MLAVLKELMDFAVRRRYIAANPCAFVRLASGRRQRKVTPLPHAELASLADAMPDAQSRAAVLVAGYCGLRAGDVWALRRNDVLLRRLRVDEKITEANIAAQDTDYTILSNGEAVGPTKTYSDEPVAMPTFVAEALAQLIEPDMAADAFLFTSESGGPIRHKNWYVRFHRPTLKAALPPQYHKVTFHDLRHTCAAYMIERGFHPKVIQQQLRHSSIQITMDVYGHLFPDGLDAVAEAMDEGYRLSCAPVACWTRRCYRCSAVRRWAACSSGSTSASSGSGGRFAASDLELQPTSANGNGRNNRWESAGFTRAGKNSGAARVEGLLQGGRGEPPRSFGARLRAAARAEDPDHAPRALRPSAGPPGAAERRAGRKAAQRVVVSRRARARPHPPRPPHRPGSQEQSIKPSGATQN